MRKDILLRRIYRIYPALALIILLLLVPVATAFASDLGLSESDCRCCHGTTLADRHHLLVNKSGLECLSCHSLTYNSTTQIYDLVVTRDCPQCHTGSLADRHHLLVDQVTYDCFTCHALVWDPVELQYVATFNNACVTPNPTVMSGTIKGSITDQNGAGLGWVKLATANGVYSTLATDAGSYEIPNVTPGTYTLAATLDGYIGTSQSVTVVDGQSHAVDFVLSPLLVSVTVSGVVSDSNQTPLEGASISTSDGVYSTTSSTDGSYVLDNVNEGSFSLTATKTGYADNTQSVSVTSGQNLTLDIVLANSLEICDDSIDNNGNGLIDCNDPTCSGAANCQSVANEICDDGIDNNSNGLTDCGEPACFGVGSCESPLAEVCNDSLDNNGDGLLDCDDPLCSIATNCLPEHCHDEIDNNGDGLVDCNDPVCADTRRCRKPPVEICDDGYDNDENTKTDCEDRKCKHFGSCSPSVADERCSNGKDDNGDGLIDCADPLCQTRAVCLHEICDNNIDDDADRRVDCEDRSCRNLPICSGTAGGGHALHFSASASDDEESYKAENVGDGDQGTHWRVNDSGKKWLKLDLGGTYPVNKVDIHWHDHYAEHYSIRLSKNGRYWKKATEVTNGDGGFDSITFDSREAHFILIECKKAASAGYSINEVEVFRSDDQ